MLITPHASKLNWIKQQQLYRTLAAGTVSDVWVGDEIDHEEEAEAPKKFQKN